MLLRFIQEPREVCEVGQPAEGEEQFRHSLSGCICRAWCLSAASRVWGQLDMENANHLGHQGKVSAVWWHAPNPQASSFLWDKVYMR